MFSRTKVAATKGSTVQKEQRLMISGRTEAIASSGQQRIWFHEQLYFHASDLSVYNIVVPLIIKQGSLSIERLRSALRSVIEQHTILRTAVRFNPATNQVEQYIQPVTDDIYLFQHSRGISTAEQLNSLLTDESIRKHFDVETGRVVKCHVVERGDESDGHSLHENDLIVFTIHHIAFDLTSSKSFVKAFERAYWINAHHHSTLLTQQYIDFAQYEQAMLVDMNPNSKTNKARRFWSDLMDGYDWNRIRAFVSTEIRYNQTRSGRGHSTVFVFDQRVVDNMMMFASSNNITMFSLSFASFYAFLFKLLKNEEDLCVASVVANRFNQETKEMIGMFVNILPYRIQIEPNKSFNHFVRKVQQLSTDILEHASLPYQEIIGLHDKQKRRRLPSTFFEYVSLMSSMTQKTTVESTVDKDLVLGIYYDRDRSRGNGLAIFDMSVTIAHDHHARTTECVIDCAVEIFQSQAIVNEVANRFQHMLTQLFCSFMIDEPIYNLSIVSSNEENLIHQFDNKHIDSSNSCTSTIQECSTIENQVSMIDASLFWFDILRDCKLNQPLSLPYDRNRLMNQHPTDQTISVSFDFGQDLSHQFITYVSSNNIKHEHLAFATYFIFLFKLTNGEKDLCISMNIYNRYKHELKSKIGLFKNIIPLRCQLDPYWSFQQLLEHVEETTMKSLKYSYFPLQRILSQHPNVSKPAFLDISFDFISSMTKDEKNKIMTGDSQLSSIPSTMNINDNEIRNKYDFSLLIEHDLNINQLSCTINASLDLFNVETINKISQRFHSILKQLFISVDDKMIKPIYEISLTLSSERLLMQSVNNTQVSFPSSLTCIHHGFVYQVMKHPQKLAVELDEQSLAYCELLYYVQVLSLTLLNEYLITPGEIICQCVERSVSMVIGIMAIEVAGGVYGPLSPRDPKHRLDALIQQTQSRFVLAHQLTKTKLDGNIILLSIDSILMSHATECVIDVTRLSKVATVSEDVAYIIFTSGSTGTPKAAQTRHRNFTNFVRSIQNAGVINEQDTVSQICAPTYDVHVMEIMGSLLLSATVVMLHPYGNMDFEYFAHTLQHKQITCLAPVPTFLNHLCDFLAQPNRYALSSVRSLCIGGEPFSLKLVYRLRNHIKSEFYMHNIYAPAECTVVSICHRVDTNSVENNIPLGSVLANEQCKVLDISLQPTPIREEGELFIGGVGVFAGYLGRDDLTAKALLEIDDQLFYRTGDLVRMDNNGLLHYQGRKDHQIKLHGQRIELGEIERCLLDITSISTCVVMKWNDDYLVAYVQSSFHTNEEELRQHCQSHLPPHMIPSIFIILDKLPLNPNGKIDRKLLPPPQFSSMQLTNSTELILPTNDNEVTIHHIWCDLFKRNQISTDTNIFTIGGHSLVIMQLFHRYKIEFHLETNTLSITDLFQHPTIIHHAQLIHQSINTIHTLDDHPWSSLNLIQASASFAQERIYLDEQIRFSSNNTTMKNMYVIPLFYRISSMKDGVSITRLHHAFQSVITKHNILRTALYIDDTNGNIIQHCLDANIILNDDIKSYGLTVINLHDDDCRHMNEIIAETLNQSDLFDLSKGHVIRCHILRQSHYSQDNVSYENDDLLTENDHLLISIHHAMFDGASTSIFLRDLSLAYQSIDSLSMDENILNYIDYSIHEHIMDMSLSREFWHSQLERNNIECSLSLPVDRRRSSTNQQRSGLASTAQIIFDNEICTSFLNYASSHHLTLFQLGLSIFYVFLFKLSHGETDLCIGSINANRYRSELVNMIGMFVSTVPYRMQLDPSWSFDEVVKYVQEKCLSILEHSHYPLQHILGDNRLNQSNVSFLETMFDFISVSKDVKHLCLNDVNLEKISLEQSTEVSKFDFSLTFEYNPLSDNKRLSCSFICSSDLFEKSTISKIAQRFEYMFEQLFQTQPSNTTVMNVSSSINKLSLILPEEDGEMELAVFHRLENIVNEVPASFAQARIWLDERIRFDPDKPQVAIYNMPFVYRLQSGHTLSIKQLCHALHLTLSKHSSLHTSLHFDIEKNQLMQQVITHEDKNNRNNSMFSIIETAYETEEQLNEILHDEKRNPQVFNLSQGLVFRCHIIYYKQISSNDLLSDKDLLIFNFHHALFDFPSMKIFHHDLNQAYTTGILLYDDNTNLRYLDYAAIEQQMSMTGASMFWLDVLHNCKLDQPLPLPFDRYRLSNEHRTGHGTCISFDFGQDLSHDFLIHASSNSISLEHLALATYFIFLLKLTNGENDLCIGINTHGRYRDELTSIIGMFVNAIPLRCQLDPHLSFHKITKHVQNNMINCIKYSYFPLQRILNQHPNISNPVFLDTAFEFISSMTKDEEDEIMIGDSRFSLLPYSIKISEDEIMSKFDFILSFRHDMNLNELSCTINASLDLFNVQTVCTTGQRLQTMLHQQFTSFHSQINKPVHELSLTLSNEQYLMQSLNNTQVSFSSPLTCIHHEFVYQVMKHPQKLAVELDEQSLTYCELLHYVQVLSLTLLNKYLVAPGEIVCQCVERSLSMVIGIMAIEMVGGVYCPLSPRDPQHRLHALTQQTQSRLVLVHGLTTTKFDDDIISLDINSLLTSHAIECVIDVTRLSKVITVSDDVAYIIFTSGSTGKPKAVQVQHKNFTGFMSSLVYGDVLNEKDTILQMARCSFDVHVHDILGSFMTGSSLIMLHPRGIMDFDYLANVMTEKNITCFASVPTIISNFFTFLQQQNHHNVAQYLRSICSGGEPCSLKLINLMLSTVMHTCRLWNMYGPAETTIDCTFHLFHNTTETKSFPIGRPLSNYQNVILDQFSQNVFIDQEGELLVGGVGVYAGYLGRDDLTAKALVEIDDELFYRTGDLVTIDNCGLIHYQGRKDYQVKLHGQRIELGEIERCLLNITSISSCVVMKWNDDYLVAYVQSSFHTNEEELRQHCQSHLPPHMIPSIFIILDKLPLNPNGKVDRKLLPSPHLSSMHLTNSIELLLPTNHIEDSIHRIWCEIFKLNQISTNTNIFTIGGHSLVIMQLFYRYKIEFHLETNTLSISNLFQHPTIIHHAQLIQQSINTVDTLDNSTWSTLHFIRARASFAQERIYLDEQIRFSSNNTTMKNMYVIPLLYRISSMHDHVSITRLYHVFQSVITKHNILRTALYLDTNATIIQDCLDTNAIVHDKKSSRFTIISLPNEEHEQNEIIKKILNQSDLFDLSRGHVVNCHILRRDQLNHPFTQNNDLLTKDDRILFTIHHACFDGASTSIFIRDLSLAYQSNGLLPTDDSSLQYIDYSIHEHIMDMTLSQGFWLLELKGYNLTRQLSLPVDRQRSSTSQQRSGLASIAEINFNNEICTSFLNYASSHHLTLFQLGLSIFYVFLFKLSHGETDLCIGSINANRYRSELVNMIGMFVSTLPYRIQLDPLWSFDEVVKYVQKKCLSILTHSHYPLQHILADLHLTQSNASFLETMFDFIIISDEDNDLSPASFAQTRLWHNECVHFTPHISQVPIYNMLFVYHLHSHHTLSVQHLRHALQLIVTKHESFRTSLVFDTEKNLVMQRIIDMNNNNKQLFTFIESSYETQEQLNDTLHDEKRNPHLFDLAQGLVFRCHLVYYKQISSNDLLSDQDVVIFNFHHALFDLSSMNIFLRDLNQAYTTDQLLYDDNTNLRYLDYAVIEQQMLMTGASMFWLDALHNCKLDQPLPLPFDRYRLSNEHRTGHGTCISFDFGQDLSHDFLIHASSNNISLEHLTFALYFIFLFKLTNEQTDLCLAININNNRYRDELKSIIGLFENVIPLRCQLDPHWCFHQLFEHIQEITSNSMKYSYFPLQHILNQHPHISKHAFLETSLEFLSYKSHNAIMIGDSQIIPSSFPFNINEDEILSVYDFSLSIHHDLKMNQLLYTINASLDLFNRETAEKISQQLHSIVHHLSASIIESQINKPIYEVSLTLSNEQYLMQSLNNTQVSFSSPLTCIHHEFVYQVMKHPQKLAVELDEQSLTYCELLHYVQVLSLTLLNEYHVLPGEIVCQCVERSLSMVIGIMAILMAGGVYCSLSPQDPEHRLHEFIQQTQSRLVLVHWLTKMKFNNDIVLANIHSILANTDVMSDAEFDHLSSITVTSNDISFIIFTSGSTGIPKAIQYRHENFIRFIYSFGSVTTLKNDDLVIQIVRCTYDGHLRQIVGILLIGATCVMLHPRGMTDFEYLADVFYNKQITHFSTVPTLIQSFFSFLMQYKKIYVVKYLRLLCSAGEVFPSKLIDLIQESNIPNCTLWNLYGPAEATIVSTFYRVHPMPNTQSIPIGTPLSNYRCMVINEYLQRSITNQDGELFIGGVGVFAGYLGRDDLTAKALVEIDDELFYRTGDLVTMDNCGLIHYQGRKDYQVKLRGQRIELGEIERCLLNITSISSCVVMKWNDDYLVAYVQSSHVNEEELREHCQSHLPSHMVPSVFIILDKLPLNQNGKVDRKQFPSPQFSLSTLLSSDKSDTPLNQFEERIHTIWCQVLHSNENQISATTSFFSAGGHSLRFIELYYRYQSLFSFDTHSLSIGLFLQQPTIRQHAQLLQTLPSNDTQTTRWQSLYINQDPSQDVINLCQRLYSTTPRLSFVVADATKHLLFENESIDIILCIEATLTFGEPIAITQLANEVIRILRPNGYLLWCDFCYMNGSDTSVYDLIANDELIIEEKINITKNVLHALDIQNRSRTDFIQRYIQPADQEYCRLLAGLSGT
ncbi:unnamed protein product [Adineta steineri]|uniref:Carrier domain-containing protein n=1 Tax=Adineta steineri TaxID=433720 RepID=A0A814Q8I6_9BILA|nr:unnamed protein product [Adineta steineri]